MNILGRDESQSDRDDMGYVTVVSNCCLRNCVISDVRLSRLCTLRLGMAVVGIRRAAVYTENVCTTVVVSLGI